MLEILKDQDTPLEVSLKVYEEAMGLLKKCNESLDLTEKKIMAFNEKGEMDEFS